jgi:hypothetical protein
MAAPAATVPVTAMAAPAATAPVTAMAAAMAAPAAAVTTAAVTTATATVATTATARALGKNAGAARSAVGPKTREACVWGGCGRSLRRWGAAEQHRPGQRAGTHCTGGRLTDRSQ